MHVGIYGGSFDPVHLGHLAVADAAHEQLPIDQLRWMPVGSPWQKTRALATAIHRVAMLRLALEGTSDTIDERETMRRGPTYTIDTLDALALEMPAHKWMLVIGQDQYARFQTWHRWRDIIARAVLAVVARDGEAPTTTDEVSAAIADARRRVHVLRMRPVPVSSTLIRQRIARGESIIDMVPAKVAGYIDQHGLYR
jgi:nicotinate-nucleotide adenylyltransferase